MPQSYMGSVGVYPQGPIKNPLLESAITGLLTPGLVPDIARQSAEISSGRGVGGSPAAASTAVRMSEKNWQDRLALANSLMTGQTGRDIQYQITPWQQAYLEYMKSLHGLNRGGMTFGGGQPSGGGRTVTTGTPMSIWSNVFPVIEPVGGTRPNTSGSGGGILTGGYQGTTGGYQGTTSQPYPETLDDVYDWLGFGNFGSLPGDTTNLGVPDFGSLTPGMPDLDWDF